MALGNKEVLAKNLAYYIDATGLSQKDFAEKLSIKPTTLNEWLKAKKYPRIDTIELLANYFHIQKSDLIEEKTEMERTRYYENILPLPEMSKLPLIGTIACGAPILAQENIEDWIDVPLSSHSDFVLRCKGDSMTGARIMDGDLVCIRNQQDVIDGQIAAVLIDDEATLKRVYHNSDGSITLQAENSKYPPVILGRDGTQNIKIIGLATYFISKAV